MSTIAQVAKAFSQGKAARCHNAYTDGQSYWLHGSMIARKYNAFNFLNEPRIELKWCGWYTRTTANHLNKIVEVFGYTGQRLSYKQARDNGHRVIVLNPKRGIIATVLEALE